MVYLLILKVLYSITGVVKNGMTIDTQSSTTLINDRTPNTLPTNHNKKEIQETNGLRSMLTNAGAGRPISLAMLSLNQSPLLPL